MVNNLNTKDNLHMQLTNGSFTYFLDKIYIYKWKAVALALQQIACLPLQGISKEINVGKW